MVGSRRFGEDENRRDMRSEKPWTSGLRRGKRPLQAAYNHNENWRLWTCCHRPRRLARVARKLKLRIHALVVR
jgi:hypothetical protein